MEFLMRGNFLPIQSAAVRLVTMPIVGPSLPRLSDAEMRVVDYEVMAHVFAVHRELGRLCDESIYQCDLAERLMASGIPVGREVPVTLSFRDFITTRELDLIVAEKVVYELKAASQLTSRHEAQLLNYLNLTGGARGKLVNFRPASIESRFANATLDHAARHSFTIAESRWQGPEPLRDAVKDLVADWGTSLEASLYHDAIVHACGGEAELLRLLPLQRRTTELGRQRFYLCASDAAFGVTCLEAETFPVYELQLRRLIQFTSLQFYHWINIARHGLQFVSLRNHG